MKRLANLRDVGGLPAAGARATRHGVLLRSDAPQPGDAEPRDLPWPPRLVLDLRSPGEVGERHPLDRDGLEVRSIPLAAEARIDRIAEAHPTLQALYERMAAASTGRIVEAVRSLAHADGVTLVHCAAGKDRTGLLVALVLSAVDVERPAVLADYTRTGQNMRGVVERLTSDPAAADMMARVVTRRPEYLDTPAEAIDAVLTRIEAEHGHVRTWLIAQGLEEDAFHRLEHRLLEPRPV